MSARSEILCSCPHHLTSDPADSTKITTLLGARPTTMDVALAHTLAAYCATAAASAG